MGKGDYYDYENSSYYLQKQVDSLRSENDSLNQRIDTDNQKITHLENTQNELQNKVQQMTESENSLLDYNDVLKTNVAQTKINLETSEVFGESVFLQNQELNIQLIQDYLEMGTLNEAIYQAILMQNKTLEKEIKTKTQEYSTDEQKVFYLSQQIDFLQKINTYFFFLYY